MKKNATIFIVLLLLAIVPVTISFFSKDEKSEGAAAAYLEDEPGAAPAPQSSIAAGKSASSSAKTAAPVNVGGKAPVFPGFEKPRYQQYDRLIEKLVADFNARRTAWAGCTGDQASGIKPLTVAQVKAHMIQETGGGDVRSRAAWAKDPLQVNVPGDWNPYKKYLGLREPRKRNEGSLEKNLKAGIMLLARKGFGVSGQPAANQPAGRFDGWPTSLKRYNGRSDKAADGRPYRDAYAAKILDRSSHPTREVPITIKTRK